MPEQLKQVFNPLSGNFDTVKDGANKELDNLQNTAINTNLLPDTDLTHNIGSATKTWANIYVQGVWGSDGTQGIDLDGRILRDLNGDQVAEFADDSVGLHVFVDAAIDGNLSASNFSGSSTGTNSGDVTLTTVGSSPNGNGASLSGQQLRLQPADATNPGVVTTGAQTFAGVKTFSSAPVISSITNTGTLTLPTASTTLVGRDTTDTLTNKTIDAASNTISNIANANISASAAISFSKLATLSSGNILVGNGSNVATSVAVTGDISLSNAGVTAYSGTVPLNKGGTGQTTKAAAFDALSPMTTGGDIIYGGASGTGTRLANGSAGQVLTSAGGTSAPTWSNVTADMESALMIQNLGLATSLSGNALTIALKQKDGSTDPSTGTSAVKVGMRSSTLTSGLYNIRSVTSSLSLTISSGSTLGTRNGQVADIYVYLIDNSGTLELAASQILFDEAKLVSTTAEGGSGAADSNSVMYSTTARTNVPFRCIGRLTSTQATAGTYATAISNIALGGYDKFSQTERIYARYTTASGTSISNATFTILDFNTRVEDTKNIVSGSGSSWVATMPKDGICFVNASFRFLNTTSNGNYVMRIGKNATTYYRPLDFNTGHGGANATPPTNGGASFPVSKGDTVTLEAYQSTGGSVALISDSENNYIELELV